MYTYTTTPQPRIKRVVTTVTRTFDKDENLVEEREVTETEYEYTSGYAYTNPGWNQPYIWNGSGNTYTLDCKGMGQE